MMKVIGVVIFIIGVGGWYWTSKRAFERRNEAGVEEFKSFGQVVGFAFLEGVVKITSILFVIFGFMALCMGIGFDR